MSASYTTNIPPLENGDRLTCHEFERRYQATGQLKKAELIEGTDGFEFDERDRSNPPHENLKEQAGMSQGFETASIHALPGARQQHLVSKKNRKSSRMHS